MERVPSPRIRAELITAVLQFVAGAGGNPAQVRSAAGLRAGELIDPERLLDVDRLAATVDAAAHDLGDPAFGLHLGANFDLEGLGPLSYAVLNAPTAAIGVANLVRYMGGLAHGVRLELVRHGGEAVLRGAVGGAERADARHLNEGGILVMVRMLRRLAGTDDWHPRAVSFVHPRPVDVSEHVALFGVEPQFGHRGNEIHFDARVLAREVRHADRSLLPVVERRLQEVLRAEPGDEPWLAALRVEVASRLCDGHPSLADVAPDLGLSARTLQRRLAERGLVYRDLVQGTRRQLALEYLERGDTDLTEVALLLGYAELSAFTHAFRRWTGASPGAHRRARRSQRR